MSFVSTTANQSNITTVSAGATEPTSVATSDSNDSPGHISFEAVPTTDASWSTTLVSPQQLVAEDAAITTDVTATASSVVAVITDTTTDTTAGRSEVSSSTASSDGSTGSAGVSTTTTPATTDANAAQPTVADGTPDSSSNNTAPANPSATTALGSGDATSPATGVDRVRFVQRVARAFQTISGGGGSVKLRLSPPELGSVRLEVSVKNGVLTAHAQTETAQARDALVENLPELRARLSEQNIQIDHFDVDLFDSAGGGMSNQSQFSDDRSMGYASTSSRMASNQAGTTTVAAEAPSANTAAAAIVNGGLNVLI